jgi:hypothetical protein
MWTCPTCRRRFTRTNQRHACGTGDRAEVLRNRPPELVAVYAALEQFVKTLGPVEFVTRDRYVLLRTTRIFTDLVIMSDAVRVAIHLPKRVSHEAFIKVASDRKQVTHVAKLRTRDELEAMKPFLREAYAWSVS